MFKINSKDTGTPVEVLLVFLLLTLNVFVSLVFGLADYLVWLAEKLEIPMSNGQSSMSITTKHLLCL